MDSDFQMGPWTVRPSLNLVYQNGTSSHLEPKVMQVLVCLAAQAGEVVSKETILNRVWPGTFVSDDVLIRSIFELRRTFEDEVRDPRFIQTIPKRGYRLVAAVRPVDRIEAAAGLATARAIEPRRPAVRTWGLVAICVAVLVLICGLLAAFNVNDVRERLVVGDGSPSIHSLAVLPLRNLSGDPTQEYFSDGMTEELITELSRIRGMRVISRTSVMRYKNSDKSLPEIARQLGVDGIVEGSVLRSGDRVRITAQLISARTDANVWAETYDRDSRDILALQEAVASAIAGRVKATMVPLGDKSSQTPHSIDLRAHEAFLRGWHEDDIGGTLANRYGMERTSLEHFKRAVEYYKEAIRDDPLYARAYLALAYEDCAPESRGEEEANAKKALEIDSNLSEAHLLLGAIKLVRDRNWSDAERELLRAIELNPNSAAAHQGYAYYLDAAGRLDQGDQGMKEYYRAQELDPANDHLAPALYSRRQFERLIELERDQLAGNPGNAYVSAVAHKTLMVSYARLGKTAESIEEFRQALIAYGYDTLADHVRHGYKSGGYRGALREWLKGVQKQKLEFPFTWVTAYINTELGDRDAAIGWLPKMEPDWEPMITQGANVFPNLVSLRIEPMWDPLRSDSRFEELERSMRFPH